LTHLGAAGFGIAATVSLLAVYIGRPAPSAVLVERQAPIVAEGKSDRLLLPAAEPSIALPPKPRADPVCGPRGRTWYVKENGWRYWRCVR
jgi:hypothetical protein